MRRLLAIILCLSLLAGGIVVFPASQVEAAENECIELSLTVPDGVTGALAVYDILFNMDNQFWFQAGDKLEYDVWLSEDVAGVGGLDLCFGYEQTQVLRGNAVDANGIGSHPSADLSDHAYDQWYHRSIEVSDNFVSGLPEGVGPAVVFAVDLSSCGELAGKTVKVRYDNIRITRNGLAVQEIYPGQNTALPETPGSYVSVNPGATVGYQLITLDDGTTGGAGNETGGETGGILEPSDGADQQLEMKLTFPENVNGALAVYDILFTMDNSFRFQSGDRLEYEVWLSEDTAGIGGLDLCFGYDTNQVLREGGIDSEGIGAHPASDLSDHGYNQWYHRSIGIPEHFVTGLPEGVGPSVIFAVDVPQCQSLAGKTVVIRYSNIRIIRDGETVQDIYPGQNHQLPAEPVHYVSSNPGVTVAYQLIGDHETGGDTGDGPGNETGGETGDKEPGDETGGVLEPSDGPAKQLEMKLTFPENVSGALAAYDILFTMDYNFRFQSGDRLEYDVWLSEDTAGIGGLDLCFGYEPNQVLRETGIDDNGVGAHPASDLSDYAYNQWHHRSIQVSENFVTGLPEGVGPAVVFAADLPECKNLAGKTVVIRYSNIRITRNGEAVQEIYPGQNNALPADPVSYVSVNPGIAVEYQLIGDHSEAGETPGSGSGDGSGGTGESGSGTGGETNGTGGNGGASAGENGNETGKLPENKGNQIEMTLSFPENVHGPLAVYDILFTMDYNFRFQAGDRLEYDVWLSEDAAGIGGLDLCFGYDPDQVLRETGMDSNGIGAHPVSDLSDYAYQKWYHRSIGITDNFISGLPEGVGPAVVFAVDIPECEKLAGKTVTICYTNIRITRNGEAVQEIYPGQNSSLPEHPVSYVSVNPGVGVSYRLSEGGVSGSSGAGETKGASSARGTQLKMTLIFPENVSGPLAVYDILFTMDYNFRFQKGDKLEYDVWISEDVAGIGGLDLCFGYEENQILRGNGVDANGIGSHPASDLADYAYQKWYHRSIGITDNFITDLPTGVGPAVIFAADIPDCASLAGKTVTICYENIRITRNGKTVQDIFPGQNTVLPENPTSYVSVNPGVTVRYAILNSPKTGDPVTALPFVLFIFSGAAIVVMQYQQRRKNERLKGIHTLV